MWVYLRPYKLIVGMFLLVYGLLTWCSVGSDCTQLRMAPVSYGAYNYKYKNNKNNYSYYFVYIKDIYTRNN